MTTHWWHRRRIDHYFAGRLGIGSEARLRARMNRCAGCRAHYRRHLVMESALPGGDERALDRLWHGVLGAAGRPVPSPALSWAMTVATPPPPVRSWWRLRFALGGAMTALLIAVAGGRLISHPRLTTIGEPSPRGALPVTAGAPAIHIFRSVSPRAAEPVDVGPIQARDGLLFAYSNPDAVFTHLMVFAVDESYAVHWYYPAYQRAGEDPAAIPILPGTTGAELGEEIRQRLRPGPLRIYALFLREPHRVLEIEALVRSTIEEPRRALSEETPLPLPGSTQRSLLLQVTP